MDVVVVICVVVVVALRVVHVDYVIDLPRLSPQTHAPARTEAIRLQQATKAVARHLWTCTTWPPVHRSRATWMPTWPITHCLWIHLWVWSIHGIIQFHCIYAAARLLLDPHRCWQLCGTIWMRSMIGVSLRIHCIIQFQCLFASARQLLGPQWCWQRRRVATRRRHNWWQHSFPLCLWRTHVPLQIPGQWFIRHGEDRRICGTIPNAIRDHRCPGWCAARHRIFFLQFWHCAVGWINKTYIYTLKYIYTYINKDIYVYIYKYINIYGKYGKYNNKYNNKIIIVNSLTDYIRLFYFTIALFTCFSFSFLFSVSVSFCCFRLVDSLSQNKSFKSFIGFLSNSTLRQSF